ncbi:hypothetical protein JW921_01330 [Candidatus Fermentibacterales bacterium]|nr:hypothetical protein [Candidatus Fermentibacterales bacterium]
MRGSESSVIVIGAAIALGLACGDSGPTGPGGGGGGGTAFYGTIDHSCTDLDQIPSEWISTVQDSFPVHYAHTSHGSQLTVGLERIEDEDATYDVEIGYSYLPEAAGALCIFDGQEWETYITPDLYWETAEGMDYTRDVLDSNPSIRVSMWCWCCQLDYYGEMEVLAYLDSMSQLESEYPDIEFVYMTGNAQATGIEGYQRYQRNEQIRQYCEQNDKTLFDFADLDAWWYNPSTSSWEHHWYDYGGIQVPGEHPQFHGDEAGHTTYESCEQKARATWWLLARIAGWPGP